MGWDWAIVGLRQGLILYIVGLGLKNTNLKGQLEYTGLRLTHSPVSHFEKLKTEIKTYINSSKKPPVSGLAKVDPNMAQA